MLLLLTFITLFTFRGGPSTPVLSRFFRLPDPFHSLFRNKKQGGTSLYLAWSVLLLRGTSPFPGLYGPGPAPGPRPGPEREDRTFFWESALTFASRPQTLSIGSTHELDLLAEFQPATRWLRRDIQTARCVFGPFAGVLGLYRTPPPIL